MDNSINFGSATHVYFYTTNGKRIVSDKNIRKCQFYLVSQLNNSSRLKERNSELIKNFSLGDNDYKNSLQEYKLGKRGKNLVRSVYEYSCDRAKAFVNVLSGKDVEAIDKYGKEIGKAKHLSKERIGTVDSFETVHAINKYNLNAPLYADKHGIYKNGKRQAFGVIFEPKENKNGELKFKYIRSGFFDEDSVK